MDIDYDFLKDIPIDRNLDNSNSSHQQQNIQIIKKYFQSPITTTYGKFRKKWKSRLILLTAIIITINPFTYPMFNKYINRYIIFVIQMAAIVAALCLWN